MARLPCSHHLQSLNSISETSRDQLNLSLQALRARNYAEGTLGVVVIIIKRLFRSLPAPRKAILAQDFTQVTPVDIDAFLAAMQAGELAPATINLSLTILKGFFEFLRQAGEIQLQPVLKHRHTILTPTHLPKPMTEADVVAFFKVIDAARSVVLPPDVAVWLACFRSLRADLEGHRSDGGHGTHSERQRQRGPRRLFIARR